MKRLLIILISIMLLLAGCSQAVEEVIEPTDKPTEQPTTKPTEVPEPTPSAVPEFMQEYDGAVPEYKAIDIGFDIRGMSLGNALEAPNEGDWGITLEEEYFTLIAEKGYNLIRLPARVSAHTMEEAPYTIDEDFLNRITWAVDNAIANDLMIIVDLHHYEEFLTMPYEHEERFYAIWEQLSLHFGEYSDLVWFEPCNEPNGALSTGIWNDIFINVYDIIRKDNPTKKIVVGGGNWNKIQPMSMLELPKDENIVLTFHYYDPFGFTHQGAEWVSEYKNSDEVPWLGLKGQKEPLESDFDTAARISSELGYPLLLGEFGAYSKAPYDSRLRWTAWIRKLAEDRDIGWVYWEFAAGFGIYNPDDGTFYDELVESMIPQ